MANALLDTPELLELQTRLDESPDDEARRGELHQAVLQTGRSIGERWGRLDQHGIAVPPVILEMRKHPYTVEGHIRLSKATQAWLVAAEESHGLRVYLWATQDHDAEVRKIALERLASTSASHQLRDHVLTALIHGLYDEDPLARTTAAGPLFLYGADARYAVPRLIELLWDPQGDVAEAAESCLGSLGVLARPARESLLFRVLDERGCSNRFSALSLGSTGELTEAQLHALIAGADHPTSEVRVAVPLALGILAETSPVAREALEQLTTSDDPELRESAREAHAELMRRLAVG